MSKILLIPRDDWNLTQGPVTSFYVDIPLAFEPTNQGTYRYSVGDHTVSVRYSVSPDGGVRVRMFPSTDMDLPDDIILAWSKDPTLGITHQPLIESTKETTMSKEPVIDESTQTNKETKMTIHQRTEYKLEQHTSKDGLLWTTNLRLGKDHPRGIVEVAGQCRVLDSDGLVMHHYREVRSGTVSAKLIDLYSVTSCQYESHVLELTTPKGWVPQNAWLHVITSNEDPALSRMELYCDFRIEESKEEYTTLSAEISGWYCKDLVMVSEYLFQVPGDYKPELAPRPILTGKVVFESGKVLDESATRVLLGSIEVQTDITAMYNRLSIALVIPSRHQLRPNIGMASLVRLSDQGAYRLVLTCDFTLTSPNPYQHTCAHHDRHVEAVDIHRPQDTEVLPVNPEPLAPSDNSPKPGQTDGTVVHQSPWTPRQLVKEIYANRNRRIDEILQSVNNYFTFSVREELCTDPDLKLVLESPVTKDLVHRLYFTLTDAGYDVDIDNEKLNFTVKLPPLTTDPDLEHTCVR